MSFDPRQGVPETEAIGACESESVRLALHRHRPIPAILPANTLGNVKQRPRYGDMRTRRVADRLRYVLRQ